MNPPAPFLAPPLPVSPAGDAAVERLRAVVLRRDRPGLAAVLGLAGILVVVTTAPVRDATAPADWRPPALWRLTLPFVKHPGGPVYSSVAFVIGMALLAVGWWLLANAAADRSVPLRRRVCLVAAVAALWVLPTLLSPPLLSKDVYSYAAQGELSSRGADPTAVGPEALGGGPFFFAADKIWRDNPAPYGPVWNKVAETVVVSTDHDLSASVYRFRLVILAGVVLGAVGLGVLAASLGVDPAVALAIGVANPLMLVHVVGGIHNDGLMLGLLLAGLALARRGWRVAGLALVVAAAAVKLPAIAGLAFLGWDWGAPFVTRARRFAVATFVGVVGTGALLATNVVAGYSFGWLAALKGTSKVKETFAPATLLGRATGDLGRLLGLPVTSDTFIGVFRFVGMLAALALAWWLLQHAHEVGIERAFGLASIGVILLGPVLWPWYLPPALAVLAATGLERFRPALWVAAFSTSLFVFPASAGNQVALARYQAFIGLALLAALVTLALYAQELCDEPVVDSRRWGALRRWRARRAAARAGALVLAAELD